MKRKSFLTILLMLFPLLIAIGLSTWVIVYEVVFTPNKVENTNPLIEYFGVSQETTYDYTTTQHPVPKDGSNITGDITYKYKLTDSDTFIDGEPKDAGVYDVQVTVTDGDSVQQCQVKFTINPKKVKLSTKSFSINYTKSNYPFTQLISDVTSQVVFVDSEGTQITKDEFSTGTYLIKGIHNGKYFYSPDEYKTEYKSKYLNDNYIDGLTISTGTASTSTQHVLGTTYAATVELNKDVIKNNYELIEAANCIIKYNTVTLNADTSKYYTIEDALAGGGDISFVGDSSSAKSHIITAFTSLTLAQGNPYGNKTEYTLSSRTLRVPYENTFTKDFAMDQNHIYSGNVFSAVIIPENITLNLNNSSRIVVAAFVGYNQYFSSSRACTRGIIMNYGTINLSSGTYIYSYGYIKGSGKINMASGSTIQDSMTIFDFPGGSAGSSMYRNVMPSNAWSIHNVSCETIINAGAIYNGFVHVIMSSSEVTSTPTFIGSSSTSNCIFKGISGYIRKTTENAQAWIDNPTANKANLEALTTITGSNQTAGQRDVFELYGQFQDSSLSIKLQGEGIAALLSIVNMKTSTEIAAPISYLDIIIKSNSKLELTKSDYMFFPGCELLIEKGAVVTVGSDVDVSIMKYSDIPTTADRGFINYCVDKTDASFINNGSLTVNGNMGGTVKSTQSGAIYSLSTSAKNTSSFTSMTSVETPYYHSATLNLTGNIDNVDNSSFTIGSSYISTGTGNSCYWTAATNVKTFKVEYYDFVDNSFIDSKNYQVVNGNSYALTGNEYIPEKIHYEFVKWTDVNGNDFTDTTLTDTNTTFKLYAQWKIHKYSFSYLTSYGYDEYDKEIYLSDVTYIDPIYEFTINDFENNILTITTKASYNNKNFIGWYVGFDKTGMKLSNNQITIDNLLTFIETNGADDSIPLYGEFTDAFYYDVNFVDNSDDIDDFESLTNVEGGSYVNITSYTSVITSFDDNTTYSKYFEGWYTTANFTSDSKINASNYRVDKTVTLYARWIEKRNILTITNLDRTIETLYFKEVTEYTLPDISVSNVKSKQWLVGTNTTPVEIGTKITIDGSISIKAYVLCAVTANSNTSGSGTLKIYDENKTQVSSQNISVSSGNNGPYEVQYGYYVVLSARMASFSSDDFDVSDNYFLINKNGTIKISAWCFAEETLITLYDGSTKEIENLKQGDLLLVFNHEIGKLDVAPASFIIHHDSIETTYEILNLEFSNGTILKIAGSHGLFDSTLNKYIYIDSSNVNEFLNHEFYTVDGMNTKLINYYYTTELTRVFSPISYYHLNVFANGILTVTNFSEPATNIFEYDENMKYNQDQMLQDIEKYGLFTYDDFKEYTTYEIYCAFPAQYFKIVIGRGDTTLEEILWILNTFLQ